MVTPFADCFPCSSKTSLFEHFLMGGTVFGPDQKAQNWWLRPFLISAMPSKHLEGFTPWSLLFKWVTVSTPPVELLSAQPAPAMLLQKLVPSAQALLASLTLNLYPLTPQAALNPGGGPWCNVGSPKSPIMYTPIIIRGSLMKKTCWDQRSETYCQTCWAKMPSWLLLVLCPQFSFSNICPTDHQINLLQPLLQ